MDKGREGHHSSDGTPVAKECGMVESLFQNNDYQATKALLDVAAIRHTAIASNIANLETPGYKRVDLSKNFEQELQSTIRSGDISGLSGLKAQIVQDDSATATRADGNNVQVDRELFAMASNSTNFEVLTQFTSNSLKQLRTAISGRTA